MKMADLMLPDITGLAAVSNKVPTEMRILATSRCENPFSEIQVLCKHTDIVRHLVRIDSNRCCSAGDDGLVVIWNVESGALLSVLNGHSRPVTCLCPTLRSEDEIEEWFLLTAASDRLICLWNLETGTLEQKFADLNSTTKCIVPLLLHDGLFCFAGEKLCLWSMKEGLLAVVESETQDAIQFVLVMRKNILVAAADTQIAVYECSPLSTERRLSLLQKFELHRESIRSLVQLNDSYFASGSLDGAVLLWSAVTLDVIHQFNPVEDYQGPCRTYPFSVQHLLPLDKRYLLCAVGRGICIYDTQREQLVLAQADLHDGKVLHLELICSGYLLVSCSEDSSIKLWRSVVSSEMATENSPQMHLKTFSSSLSSVGELSKPDGLKLSLELVGECQAHSAAVQMCTEVQPNQFLSCGVDHAVILWKSGIVESCKRHKLVRDALLGLGLSLDNDSQEEE